MNTTNILDEALQQMNEAFESQDPELLDTVFVIDGKKLYADKFRLSVISSTFKSMLSDRWNSKNEPIEIKGYEFDDFKRFLTYIYSGECKITDLNIFTMRDMAEFYQIHHLKELCDQHLLKMNIDFSNVFQLLEISSKYVITEMKKKLQIFILQNFENFLKLNDFLNADKSIIEELVAFALQPEEIFLAVYQWAEHQSVKKEEESAGENFNKNDAIKEKIAPFLPNIPFKEMKLDFLIKYVGMLF